MASVVGVDPSGLRSAASELRAKVVVELDEFPFLGGVAPFYADQIFGPTAAFDESLFLDASDAVRGVAQAAADRLARSTDEAAKTLLVADEHGARRLQAPGRK
jgi:hypothetical protein